MNKAQFPAAWRVKPTAQQWKALSYVDTPYLLYGGAAGGGKSIFLLLAASLWTDYPDYAALMLRRNYGDLTQEGGILNEARKWWTNAGARWRQDMFAFEFPSGATIAFGHLSDSGAHLRYQGGEYQHIAFDEAGNIPSAQIDFLQTRLRKKAGNPIPLQMRLTANPGGVSHNYLKDRYMRGADPEYEFIPSQIEDNDHLDRDAYIKTLEGLDSVTYKRYRYGDWDIAPSEFFALNELERIDHAPDDIVLTIRAWDLAATETGDYTAGVLLGRRADDTLTILDLQRFRLPPGQVERRIMQTAQRDGAETRIYIEQEPGSSGKLLARQLKVMLQDYLVATIPSTGQKTARARPLATAIENGIVSMAGGAWNGALLDELGNFPDGDNDDIVDALSLAFNRLGRTPKPVGIL